MSTSDEHFPFYVCDVKTGNREGFSTLDTAREALLSWILLQRQAGETVVELPEGQWTDSRVTKWLSDLDGQVIKLED
jgi:hypothetical protein